LPATAQKSAYQATTKILYGESDEPTLSAQAAEMTKAGHQVTTALNRQGVQEALRRDAFDLVILGATLSKEDRHHLPYMVKKAHEVTKGSGHARRHAPSRSGRRRRLRPEHAPDPRTDCSSASARGRPLTAKPTSCHETKRSGWVERVAPRQTTSSSE
jgi:hypothetical protein